MAQEEVESTNSKIISLEEEYAIRRQVFNDFKKSHEVKYVCERFAKQKSQTRSCITIYGWHTSNCALLAVAIAEKLALADNNNRNVLVTNCMTDLLQFNRWLRILTKCKTVHAVDWQRSNIKRWTCLVIANVHALSCRQLQALLSNTGYLTDDDGGGKQSGMKLVVIGNWFDNVTCRDVLYSHERDCVVEHPGWLETVCGIDLNPDKMINMQIGSGGVVESTAPLYDCLYHADQQLQAILFDVGRKCLPASIRQRFQHLLPVAKNAKVPKNRMQFINWQRTNDDDCGNDDDDDDSIMQSDHYHHHNQPRSMAICFDAQRREKQISSANTVVAAAEEDDDNIRIAIQNHPLICEKVYLCVTDIMLLTKNIYEAVGVFAGKLVTVKKHMIKHHSRQWCPQFCLLTDGKNDATIDEYTTVQMTRNVGRFTIPWQQWEIIVPSPYLTNHNNNMTVVVTTDETKLPPTTAMTTSTVVDALPLIPLDAITVFTALQTRLPYAVLPDFRHTPFRFWHREWTLFYALLCQCPQLDDLMVLHSEAMPIDQMRIDPRLYAMIDRLTASPKTPKRS